LARSRNPAHIAHGGDIDITRWEFWSAVRHRNVARVARAAVEGVAAAAAT
jgi:hypothetical protein